MAYRQYVNKDGAYEHKALTLTLPPGMWEEFAELANQQNRSGSNLLVFLMMKYIEQNHPMQGAVSPTQPRPAGDKA